MCDIHSTTLIPTNLVTVKDEHLSSKQAPQSLHRLSLPRPCRSIWVASQAHVHGLCQREVTLVREGCVDKLGRIALILVRVGEFSVNHSQRT